MSTSRLTRLSSLFLGLVLVLTAAAAPVTAHGGHDGIGDLPARIDLPDGFQPEGIESWGRHLYSGSLANGAIWKADAKTGNGRILVPGVPGQAAAGLHLDHWGRLWVAGGPNKTIRVYKARTGKLLETYTFPTTGFINDLDITRNAVYATDSLNQQLAVVPLRRWGKLPPSSAATVKPLSGDIQYTTGFNANGIVASHGFLILVQSNTGLLFRVNPRTGEATKIDTGGYSLTFGDGLELNGSTLYVVRNQLNLVAVLRLSHRKRDARFIGEITSPDLSVPTTATKSLGALWVVNARFGTPPTPTTDYWITRLPLRP
jgi:DNA-binding beta-propeller fold protein YncE